MCTHANPLPNVNAATTLVFGKDRNQSILSNSVYKQFSENLVTLCAKHGSIAGVCRGTGINRQQFSRYLAGSSLPNEQTLSKIADFFEIPQASLFQAGLFAEDNRSGLKKAIGSLPEMPPDLAQICEIFLDKGNSKILQAGTYALYMPWLMQDGRIIRSTLAISNAKGLNQFTTSISPDENGAPGSQLSGKIEGLMLEDKSRVIFFGHWTNWSRAFFVMSFDASNSPDQKTWHGLAMGYMPTGAPAAAKVIMEHVSTSHADLASVTNDGVMDVRDERISPHIRPMLDDMMTSNPSMLISTDALRSWR